MLERGLLEEKTPPGVRRLADFVSNSCLLLGAVAATAGLAGVILKRWPPSERGSGHSLALARLQGVAFSVSMMVLVLGVAALIARTGRKGRAVVGVSLALLATGTVLGGYLCSVSTP
jgi:hypothetical protein